MEKTSDLTDDEDIHKEGKPKRLFLMKLALCRALYPSSAFKSWVGEKSVVKYVEKKNLCWVWANQCRVYFK